MSKLCKLGTTLKVPIEERSATKVISCRWNCKLTNLMYFYWSLCKYYSEFLNTLLCSSVYFFAVILFYQILQLYCLIVVVTFISLCVISICFSAFITKTWFYIFMQINMVVEITFSIKNLFWTGTKKGVNISRHFPFFKNIVTKL